MDDRDPRGARRRQAHGCRQPSSIPAGRGRCRRSAWPSGGPFQGFTALAANDKPVVPDPAGRARPARRRSSGCTCPRASRTARSTTPRSRSPSTTARGCPVATTGWAPSRARTATSCSSAITRSTTRVRRSGTPARPTTRWPGAGRRRSRSPRSGEVVHAYTSLNGTQMNCSGGRMPWGSLDHLRGDGQRAGRRAGLHRRQQRPADQAARLHLRGPGRRPVDRQPITRAGRFAHEAVSFDPDEGHPLPDRGQLRLPVRVLPLHPGDRPDGDRRARQRWPAPDAGRGRASRTSTWPPPSGSARPTRSNGSTSTIRTRASRTRPAQTAPTTNDDALNHVGNQGRAKGAAYFSRLEGPGLRRRGRLLLLDAGRRSGRDLARSDRRRLRQRDRPDLGVRDRGRRTCSCCTSRPGADTLDFPDNVTASPRGTLILCEDNINDNYLRGLSRGGQLWDIALNRMVSQIDRLPPVQRRVRRLDLQPGRRDAVRQHPGVAPASRYAIWGPWERIGV